MSVVSPELEPRVSAAGAVGDLVLRIRGPVRNGQIVRLAARKCVIGSAPNCTLRLRLPGVREVHCVILRGATSVVRRWSPDTRLNGAAFQDAPLKAGDRLAVGPLELEVLTDGGTWPPAESRKETIADAKPKTTNIARRLEAAVAGSSQRTRRLLDKLDSAQRSVADLEHRAAARQQQLAAFADRLARLETRTQTAEAASASSACERPSESLPDARLASLLSAVGELQGELAREREERAGQTIRLQEELAAARLAWEQASERLANLAVPTIAPPPAIVVQETLTTADIGEHQCTDIDIDRRCAELAEQHAAAEARAAELAARARELDARAEQLRDGERELGRSRGELAVEQLRFDQERETAGRELASLREELARDELRLENRREEMSVRQKLWDEMHAEQARAAIRLEEERIASAAAEPFPPTEDAAVGEELAARSEQAAESPEDTTDADQRLSGLLEHIGLQPAAREEPSPVAAIADQARVEPVEAAALPVDREPTGELAAALREYESNLSFHAGLDSESPSAPANVAISSAPAEPEQTPDAAPAAASTDVDEQIRRIRELMAEADRGESTVSERTEEGPRSMAPVADAAEPAPPPFEPEQPETDAPFPAPSHTPPATTLGPDDEESIEAYMARLMQRVQGGAAEGPSKPAAAPSLRAAMGLEAKAEAAAAEPEPAPEPEVTRVMDASEFVPRAKAPEKSSNLEAMRELANQSARSAIENSNKRKGGQEWLFRVFYAAVSGLAGLGIASWFGWFSLIGGISAAVGLIVAALWSFQAVFLYQQAAAQAAENALNIPPEKNQMEPAPQPKASGSPASEAS